MIKVKIWCVDYTKASYTPLHPKWAMLTLKLRAEDYELTFQSKVKIKVFSKLNTKQIVWNQNNQIYQTKFFQ